MRKAGKALEEAGGMLETAGTPEEMAAAEAALGDARLAVLVAGEDLRRASEVADQQGELGGASDIIGETEIILDNANLAIVLATQSVFSNGVEFPVPSPGGPGGMPAIPGVGGSIFDAELNKSIAIFEGQIIEARRGVINSTPAPTSADRVPGVASVGRDISSEGDPSAMPDNKTLAGSMPAHEDASSKPRGQGEQSAIPPMAAVQPEDLPDPQGDDIVARQLREAATAETDPELREKLWEEYKKYRAGL